MSNPLNTNQSSQKNPREAVMSRMQEMGIDVPQGMENNPQALLQHVIQSGKVPQAQNRLNMIMNRFGRR